MLKENYTIKLEEDVSESKAKKIADEVIGSQIIAFGKVVKIYIVCPTVSDLFFATRTGLRKCTDREWNNYFKEELNHDIYNK